MEKLKRGEYFTNALTAESVSGGHPDKIADQIAELFLDFFLAKDSDVRVACEVFVSKNKITIGGELRSNYFKFNVEHERILTSKIFHFLTQEIGYDYQSWKGLSKSKLDIEYLINEQSLEISSLLKQKNHHLGAGDNSTVYGFASNHPLTNYYPPIQMLANQILQTIDQVRKTQPVYQKKLGFAPDGKIQIVFQGATIIKIVLCQQFLTRENHQAKKAYLEKEIILPLLKKYHFNLQFQFLLIPFVLGGPAADSGITGRKLLVDNYGIFSYHGGGSFAGKDPSKSDRSLALFARFVAKHLIALGLGLTTVSVQASTVIGDSRLVNLSVLHLSPSQKKVIDQIITVFFDWQFEKIIEKLNLTKIVYQPYGKYSYFGHLSPPWEQLTLLPEIKTYLTKNPLW